MRYKANFRNVKDDPTKEIVFVSYIVEAESIESAKSEASILFSAAYPDLFPLDYNLDVEWPT